MTDDPNIATIANALRMAAERFEEHAAEARKGTAMPETTTRTEITLTRPGRSDKEVSLCSSTSHPAALVVIGLAGLKHGDLIGIDAENRAKLRQWLDTAPTGRKRMRDGTETVDITPTPAGFARMAQAFDQEAKAARDLAQRIETRGRVMFFVDVPQDIPEEE